MVDYQAMYHKLSNAITAANWLLQQAQIDCEAMYLEDSEVEGVEKDDTEREKDGQ